jgi:hypothetical protein
LRSSVIRQIITPSKGNTVAASLEGPTVRYARPLDRDGCVARARQLAHDIEELLSASEQLGADAYAVRLAEAMTRSLIDQLDELARGPVSASRVASPRS